MSSSSRITRSPAAAAIPALRAAARPRCGPDRIVSRHCGAQRSRCSRVPSVEPSIETITSYRSHAAVWRASARTALATASLRSYVGMITLAIGGVTRGHPAWSDRGTAVATLPEDRFRATRHARTGGSARGGPGVPFSRENRTAGGALPVRGPRPVPLHDR